MRAGAGGAAGGYLAWALYGWTGFVVFAAVILVGAALWGVVGEAIEDRRTKDLEADLRRVCRYWFDARIDPADETRATLAVKELRDRKYGGPVINPTPPRATASPEIEITFPLWATSADHAERHGRRRLERAGVTIYDARARRI